MAGVPIRLIRNDGGKIELMAESMTMTVERGFNPSPLPFTGSTRWAADYNMNKAAIVIQGVVTDDDVTRRPVGSKGVADIDFSHNQNLDVWFPTGGTGLNIADNRQFILTSGAGAHTFVFDSTKTAASTVPTFSAGIISIGTGGITTVSDLCDEVIDAFTRDYTGSGGPDLSARFTAVKKNSFVSNVTNSRVRVTQKIAGNVGFYSPSFDNWVVDNTLSSSGRPGTVPYHIRFRKGKTDSTKSAGDKVMDLWGVMNNSNNSNTGVAITTFRLVNLLALFGDELSRNALNHNREDYIIGIQIPYQSLITAANDGEYTPRNFFMPTGAFRKPNEKDSAINKLDVGVEFDPWTADGDYTGIKGTVAKIDFNYNAAETTYDFNMVFMPADWII